MSATPEREQAEALDVLRDCYEQAVRKNWDSVNLATYDLRRALAAVSRLEAERDEAKREAVAAKSEAAYVRSTEWWDSRMGQANACIAAFDALVERAETAERRANHHREEYDLIRAEASRKIDAAVERERELTRALAAIEKNAESWHGSEGLGSGHQKALEVIGRWAREALAGGVSAAGRPPKQDLGGNEVAGAEASPQCGSVVERDRSAVSPRPLPDEQRCLGRGFEADAASQERHHELIEAYPFGLRFGD